ncbi:MAG: D-2-hydroxyacid dehydrogenase [Acidimicrobiia bacterium]|nr:D-2-hydroxyacid dehydrogenase [Acidimicrobiia bacterium]
MSFNILVVKGLTLPVVTEQNLADIQAAAGPDSTVRVVERVRDAVPLAADVDVVLGVMPKALLDATPKLRWVHATASGVDSFMYPEFVDSDVILTGEKGLVGGHLADTGFGLLLALTRQIATALRLGPEGWNRREDMRMKEIELEGMTMGIVGFGGTGRAVAKRALAFGMRNIAMDQHPATPSDGVDEVWGPDGLDRVLRESDVVAVCCPLAPETRHLFDDDAFARMKPGAIIMNVTRGEIINGDALVRALQSGHLGGAALDVAPAEPLPAEHPLWSFDNVAMTPHTAGASQLRAPRNIARFCENLVRMQNGQDLVGVVDKQLGY